MLNTHFILVIVQYDTNHQMDNFQAKKVLTAL